MVFFEKKPCCGDGVPTVFCSCTHVNYSNSVVFAEGPEIGTVAVCPFQCCEYKISESICKKATVKSC